TGLNLQNASVVVNCDLPWNPAKLEHRIARAWRKNQTRPVTVINLVSENTIEHRMLETLSNKRALADGVLDRLGNLSSIQFQSGRQAFLNRLRQLIAPADLNTSAPDRQPPLPADRALGFAHEAGRRINGALLRCEERYPEQAPHSVLYIVVDRDAAQWRERLNALHQDYFGPGRSDPLAPVRLEVIDRATDEALQRLIDAGLVAKTTRATRPLFPVNESDPVTPALTAEQQEEIAALKQQAARKLKMARVLDDAGLAEESHAALLEAILPLGTALAGERFLPKPKSHEDALLPPWTIAWGNAVPALRELFSSPAAPRQPALDSLTRLATGG
ncbi:MAG TPA: C-terminal helicase domain-containing protein, partial [Methylomirabilota bacterium]|nr:C-terminal helicase domain-containing protein [Methylomirabilota bacterium]